MKTRAMRLHDGYFPAWLFGPSDLYSIHVGPTEIQYLPIEDWEIGLIDVARATALLVQKGKLCPSCTVGDLAEGSVIWGCSRCGNHAAHRV